ncbi:uncharacterized protein [Leptinotarsa decemlineata]|uniref:uncharacterized protein n=1 Tax=Leptinotarsa decemlineata TaxID=7539 RepID=UPI003D309264
MPPSQKKINVLSQHILKPSEIENVAFATKTNSNNDDINVLTKSDNHWKVIIPATPTNSDTHLGVRCLRNPMTTEAKIIRMQQIILIILEILKLKSFMILLKAMLSTRSLYPKIVLKFWRKHQNNL